MAMEMTGRVFMRDRFTTHTVRRLTRSVFIYDGKATKRQKKKHKKGIFRGSGWIKVRVYSLSCLSFLPVHGGLASVWVWL